MDDSAWHDELRDQYRPAQVRLLLVGESPPEPRSDERRFFYSPNLEFDNLCRVVAIVLYGDKAGFDVQEKSGYLGRMRDDGGWLIDAVDTPVTGLPSGERRRRVEEAAPQLATRCRELDPSVGVLICHSLIYRDAAAPLKTAGVSVLQGDWLPLPVGNNRR